MPWRKGSRWQSSRRAEEPYAREGVSRANPTVLLWQPPQTGLGLRTKARCGMAGRWVKTVLHYRRHPEEKRSPESFPPLSGFLSTLQLGPWTCLFFMPLTSCSFLRTQGQSPRNRDPVPSPGFSEALPLYPCLLFLKLSHQTLSHSFPPSGRRGCPPTGRLLWSRATQGRKPIWEVAGYLLVKEGTIAWAPWTRPTLGCISHLHTTNLTTAVQTPRLCPQPHTGSVLQR